MKTRKDTVADIYYYSRLAHARGKLVVALVNGMGKAELRYSPVQAEILRGWARDAARHALMAIDRGAGSELAPLERILEYCEGGKK
jgi:hypothetical protein